MRHKKLVLTLLLCLALLLPALPVGALGQATHDPDPGYAARMARNAFRQHREGLRAENGRVRTDLSPWGAVFTSYLGDGLQPAVSVGFRLQEARRGDTTLYAAPPEGGGAPAPLEETARAGYDRGSFVEAYLAEDFGVEQYFVLRRPLPGSGDLVFVGVLSTTLAPMAEGDVGMARFLLDGDRELTYGPAIVRDADGHEAAVGLYLAGHEVQLTVPGDFLAAARYPVVVDPILTVKTNITNSPSDQVTPDVAASDVDGRGSSRRFLVTWASNDSGTWRVTGQLRSYDASTPTSLSDYISSGSCPVEAVKVVYTTVYDRYLVTWQEDCGDGGNIKGRIVYADGILALNTYTYATDGENDLTGVTASPAGYFMVVWTDYRTSGNNGDVYFQRVDNDGALVGLNTPVAITAMAETGPSVAYGDDASKWLVTWVQDDGIHGRTYNDDGSPSGSAFSVTANEHAGDLSTVYNPVNHEIVATWKGDMLVNDWCTNSEINGQRMAWNGSTYAPTENPFTIVRCDFIPVNFSAPEIAYEFSSGGYVVAWQKGAGVVEAAQVSPTGVRSAVRWEISGDAGTYSPRHYPSIAFDPQQGRYLYVWQQDISSDITGPNAEILIRLVDSSDVLATGTSSQTRPDIAYNSSKDEFLGVWREPKSVDNYNYVGVRGQRMSALGAKIPASPEESAFWICDPETDVECHNYGAREYITVAYDSVNNRYLVVWEDSESQDIQGRIINYDGSPFTGVFALAPNGSHNYQAYPRLAYDSTSQKYLVIWREVWGAQVKLYGALVTAGGNPSDLGSLVDTSVTDLREPAVAANSQAVSDNRFLLAWTYQNTDGHRDIKGTYIKADGTVGSTQLIMDHSGDGLNYDFPAIACDGASPSSSTWCLVTAMHNGKQQGVLLNSTGQSQWGPTEIDSVGGEGQSAAVAVAETGHFVVLWQTYASAIHRAQDVYTADPHLPKSAFCPWGDKQGFYEPAGLACGVSAPRCFAIRCAVTGDGNLEDIYTTGIFLR